MADVRVVSTSVVQARNHKEQRIELTPCDLKTFSTGTIQKGLLFFKPKPSDFVDHLKNSLSCTLDIFFPLAGRLGVVEYDDDTISVFIDCNNLGAQFVHAAADNVTIADILEPINVPPIVHSFFPLNGMINCEGVSKPLLAIQVTELDDGVCIGCTMNHSVVDGTSFWNFFNSWSELTRGGVGHISKPPVVDRRFFNGIIDFPIRIPRSYRTVHDLEFTLPPSQERVFHFSKAKLAELKAKANAHVGGTENISTLQSLLGHVWRSAIRDGGILRPNGETSLHFAIGVRPRFQPSLPEQYFGNAFVSGGRVILKEKELVEHGHGYAALQMNKIVASFTEDKVRKGLEKIEIIPAGRFTATETFMVSSSPRYNVFGTDFGWGKPVAVRSGSANKYGSKITVFPGREEGSIDIEVCTSPEMLEALGMDQEFVDTGASDYS